MTGKGACGRKAGGRAVPRREKSNMENRLQEQNEHKASGQRLNRQERLNGDQHFQLLKPLLQPRLEPLQVPEQLNLRNAGKVHHAEHDDAILEDTASGSPQALEREPPPSCC